MFFKAALSILLALFSLTTLCLKSVAWVTSDDMKHYQEISKKTKEIASSKTYNAAHQKRQRVRKDIWTAQEDRIPLHTRIDSAASTLTLLPSESNVDIIENLEGVVCWMQDRLYADEKIPMQQMRYFEAAKGTYQHATQRFVANTVGMSIFKMEGQHLNFNLDPKAAFLQGIARDVSFSVSGKTPQFQAHRFQATLRNPKQEEVR